MKTVALSLSVVFILLFYHNSNAQLVKDDFALIENHNNILIAKDNNYRNLNQINNCKAIQYKHKSLIAKYNPLSLLATTSMLIYQNIISPQLFRHCIYQRSCSNYSKAAIKEFGLIKGVFMSADRLMRCNMSAIYDIPPADFDSVGLVNDEPSKYHFCK